MKGIQIGNFKMTMEKDKWYKLIYNKISIINFHLNDHFLGISFS